VCPWNKYATRSALADFDVREPLANASMLELWAWDEDEFLRRTEGSAIRRIGFERWRRNLAIGIGNALRESDDPELRTTLRTALGTARAAASPLVAEHIDWALAA